MTALYHDKYCGFFPFYPQDYSKLPSTAGWVELPLDVLARLYWTSKSVDVSIAIAYANTNEPSPGANYLDTGSVSGSAMLTCPCYAGDHLLWTPGRRAAIPFFNASGIPPRPQSTGLPVVALDLRSGDPFLTAFTCSGSSNYDTTMPPVAYSYATTLYSNYPICQSTIAYDRLLRKWYWLTFISGFFGANDGEGDFNLVNQDPSTLPFPPGTSQYFPIKIIVDGASFTVPYWLESSQVGTLAVTGSITVDFNNFWS